MNDVRVTAGVNAVTALENAGSIMDDWRKQHPDLEISLPSDYWAMLWVSQIYATIAGMADVPGFVVGDIMEDRYAQQRKQEEQRTDDFLNFAEKRAAAEDSG